MKRCCAVQRNKQKKVNALWRNADDVGSFMLNKYDLYWIFFQNSFSLKCFFLFFPLCSLPCFPQNQTSRWSLLRNNDVENSCNKWPPVDRRVLIQISGRRTTFLVHDDQTNNVPVLCAGLYFAQRKNSSCRESEEMSCRGVAVISLHAGGFDDSEFQDLISHWERLYTTASKLCKSQQQNVSASEDFN